MKYPSEDEFSKGSGDHAAIIEAERTLRLIALLPAPAGLEDRVQAGLRTSQNSARRTARILDWPAALRPASGWMRTAAAAAIVFVVAGGGWGVYSRVQPPQTAKVIVMPQRVVSPGGFSNASAMHVPNTLNGPTIANRAAANATPTKALAPDAKSGEKKAPRKARATAAPRTAKQATPQVAASSPK
jgi:hypothetical protein